MKSRFLNLLFVFLIGITLIVTAGCRSRARQTVRATPVPTTMEADTVVVPATNEEFVREQDEGEVLTNDIHELNRTARERGWIRDVFFPYDSSTLNSAAQRALDASAEWLRQNSQFRLRIEGHCDERGTEQYNLALGDRRANAVREYLMIVGISADRLRTISYGEERPFATGHDETAWSQNRRAHLVLESAPFLGSVEK